MMWTTLAEFNQTLPFKPTVSSNLKYLPNASLTAHEGERSLREWKGGGGGGGGGR